MEELTENADEGGDEAESKHSEVKLGKLQFKVRCGVYFYLGLYHSTTAIKINYRFFFYSWSMILTQTAYRLPSFKRRSFLPWTWEALPILTSKSIFCLTKRRSLKQKSTVKP